MTEAFQKQLDAVIREYDSALSRSSDDVASDFLTRTQVADLRTRCIAAIERASGSNSTYRRAITEISTKKMGHDWNRLGNEIGVAKALHSDIQNGYMKSFEELLHGDMFGSFLEMASHLLENGYKDPAGVLAGSTLEIHLKTLSEKNDVKTTSNGKPKKTESLNAELTKKRVYTKLDQKNITAWLGLRNKAAHGHYSEFTKDQVRLFIASIQDFITRYPA